MKWGRLLVFEVFSCHPDIDPSSISSRTFSIWGEAIDISSLWNRQQWQHNISPHTSTYYIHSQKVGWSQRVTCWAHYHSTFCLPTCRKIHGGRLHVVNWNVLTIVWVWFQHCWCCMHRKILHTMADFQYCSHHQGETQLDLLCSHMRFELNKL